MITTIITVIYLIVVLLCFGMYNPYMTQSLEIDKEFSKWYKMPFYVVACLGYCIISIIGCMLLYFAAKQYLPKVQLNKLKFTL